MLLYLAVIMQFIRLFYTVITVITFLF